MGTVKNLFKVDHQDQWKRTKFVQAMDKFFRVEDYKLNVRYGKVQHEVVPKIETRDWIDNFADELDHPIEYTKKVYRAAKAKIVEKYQQSLPTINLKFNK